MRTKFLHIILSLIVFFGTTGIVVDKHFCRNELKNVSFFVKANNCHSTKKVCPRHQSSGDDDEEKNCCKNETEYIKTEQNQQIHFTEFELINPIFLTAAVIVFFDIGLLEPLNETHQYLTYRPPIVKTDIVILFQRFLC